MNILQINDYLLKKEGELNSYKSQLSEVQSKNLNSQSSAEYIIKAQEFLQTKAFEQQKRLSVRINDFISDILKSIWGDDAYTFKMDFVPKRGKTEVEMSIVDEKGSTSLKKPNNIRNGGGVLDVIALGLRLALWSLNNKREYTMILDQPAMNLDNQHLPQFGELLVTLSKKLGLQFIVINHNPVLSNIADTTYHIVKQNGISKALTEF